MTEAQWNSCTDPQRMLEFLRGKVSDRKLRLFAIGCYRNVPQILTARNDKRVLDIVERFADDTVTREQFHDWGWLRVGNARYLGLFEALEAAQASADYTAGMAAKITAAADAEKTAAWEDAFQTAWADHASPAEAVAKADAAVPNGAAWLRNRKATQLTEQVKQADLLRCLLGPLPFTRVVAHGTWGTWGSPAVMRLVETIYQERAFHRLPELAEALQVAGCDNTAILEHCRSTNQHTRGCWVVDLLLGKE